MPVNKLKILMIGPSESGKTTIANYLSESINIDEAGPPRPTQGARIVEFELPNLNVNGKNTTIDIELWDCSGDHRFESCWPALRLGAQGVILACSPSTSQMAMREMELFYNYFVSQPKLSAKQCVLFYNCTNDSDDIRCHVYKGVPGRCECDIWRFESCWPALRLGAQGVILACSPSTSQMAMREMELFYNYFVSQPKLSAKQCVLFYNCTNDSDDIRCHVYKGVPGRCECDIWR